jgi:hypothetical protein
MSGCVLILVWIGCVLVGAAAGYAVGYLVWKLGFELIGSAIALVGAGAGGILVFFGFLNWQENRNP